MQDPSAPRRSAEPPAPRRSADPSAPRRSAEPSAPRRSADDPTSTATSAIAEAWSEVEHAGRSVDRQIECLRSILAAPNADVVAAGPLGDLVRGTPDYVAARGVSSALAGEVPEWVALSSHAVLAGLHAISILVSRGIDRLAPSTAPAVTVVRSDEPVVGDDGRPIDDGRVLDVVNGLIDEVTERYRQVLVELGDPSLHADGGRRSAPPRPTPSTTASLALHAEQLADALALVPAAGAERTQGSLVVRSTTTWLLIAVHVAEIKGWVQAVRALQPPSV